MVSFQYLKRTGTLETLYAVCEHCGSEVATPDQLRANKQQMLRFRKESEEQNVSTNSVPKRDDQGP